MRTIFMGNPNFAIPALEAVHRSEHDLIAVVSNPPKPMGRGRSLQSTPVGNFARSNGIDLIEPISLRSDHLIDQLKELKPDLFVIVAYKILPNALINIPTYGAINLHASLLPKYRGAGPIQWALMNGDKDTGVTIFQIKQKVDTGNILLQKKLKIHEDDNMLTLGMRLCEAGADMIIQTINNIESGKTNPIEQDSAMATKAPKITKDMTIIDWSWPAVKIHNWVRGLSPHPGMSTTLFQKRFRIFKTEKIDRNSDEPGAIIELSKEKLIVGTGQGSLSLLEVQTEGKKRMPIEEFMKGTRLAIGDKLGI